MADHSEVAYTTADGNDYVAHEQTYLGFLMLVKWGTICLLYTSPSPRDGLLSRMPSSA